MTIMSFRDYLHEKAEESRHNETLAYLMFLTGAVFFVGGVLETLSLSGSPNWLLVFPYYTQPVAGAVVGLALITSGSALIVFGIAAGISRSRDRGWYMKELHKATALEEKTLKHKTLRKTQKV